MKSWHVGNFSINIGLGETDDSNLDLVVKTRDIAIGSKGAKITVKEKSNANEVLYWPGVSMASPDRRSMIYNTALSALETANGLRAQKVGFFTLGFEVSRIPSWEVAEEIVKAIVKHSKSVSSSFEILLVASSPTQLSSFQFALNNIATIAPD